MSAAGLITDLLFRLVGIPAPARPIQIVPARFEWNYTTWLNIVFIALAVLVYWLYRNRARFGRTRQYAKDVVCGMQVERANAAATQVHDGTTYYFCSDRCHDKFVIDPERHLEHTGAEPMPETETETETIVAPSPLRGGSLSV